MNKKLFGKIVFFFILTNFVLIQTVFCVTESSNYKIFNGQTDVAPGAINSTNYTVNGGSQPVSGKVESTNYVTEQGVVTPRGVIPAAADSTDDSTTAATYGAAAGSTADKDAPRVSNLWVDVNLNQAEINFETDELALVYIQYGESGSFDKKTEEEVSFGEDHKFILENLSEGTEYNFTVHMRDVKKNTVETKIYTFATLSKFKLVPNVSYFTAAPEGNNIKLTWNNPDAADFAGVKILRSESQYPKTVDEGELIYEGDGSYFFDRKVILDRTYYYTIFVQNKTGLFSSGAIAWTKIIEIGEEPDIKPPDAELPDEEVDEEVVPEKEPEFVDEEDVEIEVEPEDEREGVPELPEGVVESSEKSKLTEGQVDIFTNLKQNISGEYGEFVAYIKDLPLEIKETVNERIKKGLVDIFGDLSQNIFETLTEHEREQLEELVEKPLPEKFDDSTVDFAAPFYMKGKEWEEEWHVFTDSETLLSIPANLFEKPINLITVTLDRQAFVLVHNPDTDSYEAAMKAPADKGEYKMIIQVIYEDNTFEEIIRSMSVDPYGYVYKRKASDDLLAKLYGLFGRERKDDMEDKIRGARATLYKLNRTGAWMIWPANYYGQYNPQTTDDDGFYAFMVPPGSYYLEVEAEGYELFESGLFKVEEQIVGLNVGLKKESWLDFTIVVVLSFVLLLGWLAFFLKKGRDKIGDNLAKKIKNKK